MSAWARPGVQCVCIDPLPSGGPVLNEVCEVIEVFRDGAKVALYLVGHDYPRHVVWDGGGTTYGRVAFGVDRFRPLVPQRTEADDVAQFRHLLDVPVDA